MNIVGTDEKPDVPLPNENGYFGDYGGRFVAETLMQPLLDLEKAYKKYMSDEEDNS